MGIYHYNKLKQNNVNDALSLITITLIIWGDNKYAKCDTLYIIIMDFNNSFRIAVDIRLKCEFADLYTPWLNNSFPCVIIQSNR